MVHLRYTGEAVRKSWRYTWCIQPPRPNDSSNEHLFGHWKRPPTHYPATPPKHCRVVTKVVCMWYIMKPNATGDTLLQKKNAIKLSWAKMYASCRRAPHCLHPPSHCLHPPPPFYLSSPDDLLLSWNLLFFPY